MFPTGCRSRKNWSGPRHDCKSWPRRVPKSRRAPASAWPASRRNTKPRWRRARPRPGHTARSPAASRRRRRSQVPDPATRSNLTDADSRIMPVAGGGFEQCYNAQAAVTADSLLVVATDVVQAANDKQQIEPMLGQLATLPKDLGRPQTLLGDNGYFSAANVAACAAAEIAPLLAPGRTPHHPSLDERFAAAPPAPEHPTSANISRSRCS